ncbi:cytochrome bc1 complex cytochrome b subunit [Amycolatopsis thermoflava]|uniref:cytochrome bc1 complex cytochrome b subunit n=1 Tax=Amycolatopsis thermoflava TaxID=84480 RepID=UPI003EBD8D27
MIMRPLVRPAVRAADSRLRLARPARKAMDKIFPDHWSFMLGEIALYAFAVLVITGIFLALFFEPSTAETVYRGDYAPMEGKTTSAAYASAVALSHDVQGGLLMRQTHHWAALVFIAAITLHLCRIFFTGAFRRPREINWLVGVTMLVLALLNGFTGYSMPDDLLSGTGLRITNSVVLSVPVVGEWLAFVVFGGEFPADQTIPRMFTAHVFLVPGLLIALIGVHMLILIRQKHTQFPGPGRGERNVVGSRLWPAYTLRTLALFAAVLAALFTLGGLFQINPVWIYGPFEPASATSPAQPDWFVAWEEGALRLFPPSEFHLFGYLVPAPFLPGVVLGGLTFLGLYAWPFLEARFTGDREPHQLLDRPRDHPVRLAIGVTALFFYGLLVASAADDVLADTLHVLVTDVVLAFRVLVLTVPWIAGLVAFVLARAAQGVPGGVGDITRADVKAALRRGPVPRPGKSVRPARRLECWREPDRSWRWRYLEDRDGAKPLVLNGSKVYDSEQAAAEAAATAYPDVPLQTTQPPNGEVPAPPAGDERPSRTGRVVLGAVGVLAARILRGKR